MTSFLSTYENKIDKKGRVSVPAPFRTALKNQIFKGVIAFPSLAVPAVESFGRDMLEDMNRRRLDQTLEGGDFERALIGEQAGSVVETIMSLVTEMPFDSEGRIVLPASLIDHAGITDRASFVGRGNRFQIWAPARFAEHQQQELAVLRARLQAERGT